MSKLLVIFLVFAFIQGCANRGYNTLALEVPELFPGFDASSYIINETPVSYTHLTLPTTPYV